MKNLLAVSLLLLVGCSGAQVRHSWKGNVSPVKAALRQLCAASPAPVSVALYGEMKSLVSDRASLDQGIDPQKVEAAYRNDTQTGLEQQYLEAMAGVKNFHIVDRMTLEKAFEELKFSLSGALSPSIRVRIGEMSGATHLILFQDTYYPGTQSHTVTVRLITLETGEVLASQSTTKRVQ